MASSPTTEHDAPLALLTTLHLGGPAATLVTATTEDELIEALRDVEDRGPLLVLAGGSNVVIADEGFSGRVVRIATRGIVESSIDDDIVELTVAAGEPWDPFVARCVAARLAGIEALSGIPGSAGATPIQNVGAYGQDVSETIAAVRVYDRGADRIDELRPAECGFGYRTSALRHRDDRIVLAVTFRLVRSERSGPIRYAELARALGVEQDGDGAPLAAIRDAVLRLRRGKGMVVDLEDPDSASAGSFFTNPVLDADAFAALERRAIERLGPDDRPPRFAATDGRVKTSAAWLIERSGFARGHGSGPIGLSRKHVLAIVNRGDGTTRELVAFARELRDGVREAFGVELMPEPVLVGVEL